MSSEEITRRVLAPVDFSDLSKHALRLADRIAAERGAELTVLHVHPIVQTTFMDMTYTEPPERLAQSIRALEEQMDAWVADLKTPAENIVCKVVLGTPVEQITEESSGHGLLVISTHGRTGFSHFLMGSVAERVVRAAKCAVLVAKHGQDPLII